MNWSEVLSIIGTILGIVFLYLKNKETGNNQNIFNRDVALKALAAGVLEAYNIFTQAAKAQAPDAKLPGPAQDEAHKIAIDVATTVAKAQGVDLKATLGNENTLVYNIRQILEDLKTKGVIKS